MKKLFLVAVTAMLVLGFSLSALADPRNGRQGPFGIEIRKGNAVMIDRNGFMIKQYTHLGEAVKADMYNNRVYVLIKQNVVRVYDINGVSIKQYMLPVHGNWIRD